VGDGTTVTNQSIQTALLSMLTFLTDSELGKKVFPELNDWKYDADCNKILVHYLLKILLDKIKGDIKDSVPVANDKIEQWLSNCGLLLKIYEVVFTLLLFGQLMAIDDIRKSLGASTVVEDGEEMNTEIFLYPLKLPPVTPGHNDNFSSSLLDRTLVMALNNFIPANTRGKFYPLFSSVKHGESFSTMCSRSINKGPTLLIIRDTKGYVFGVFAAESWKFGPQFFGKTTTNSPSSTLSCSYFFLLQETLIASYLPFFLNLESTILQAIIPTICIYNRMPRPYPMDW